MSCDFGAAGTLTATGGAGAISSGHYEITGISVDMPQGGSMAFGSSHVEGAIFGPGATGGTFAFQNQDSGAATKWEAAVGVFIGEQQ